MMWLKWGPLITEAISQEAKGWSPVSESDGKWWGRRSRQGPAPCGTLQVKRTMLASARNEVIYFYFSIFMSTNRKQIGHLLLIFKILLLLLYGDAKWGECGPINVHSPLFLWYQDSIQLKDYISHLSHSYGWLLRRKREFFWWDIEKSSPRRGWGGRQLASVFFALFSSSLTSCLECKCDDWSFSSHPGTWLGVTMRMKATHRHSRTEI